MPATTDAAVYQMDSYPYMSLPLPAWPANICNCVGGPNCCIKVAEREREARIRAEVRADVLEECRQHLVKRHKGACVFFDAEMEIPENEM